MAEPLEILVDADVQVPAEAAPKKVVDALRRQLRQHDLARLLQHDSSQRGLLSLLQTRQGRHRLPQGLLQRVTQTCRRHGVPYAIVDHRAMVSCPALRSSLTLSEPQKEALRRLLVHDSGVLVADDEGDRIAVAIELLVRRQQRTLLVVDGAESARRWVEAIDAALSLQRSQIGLRDGSGTTAARAAAERASEEQRVVVATYAQASLHGLGRAYGMVIFDALHCIDPLSLMRAVRATDARYLLGLAGDANRADSLGDALCFVLGGVVHEMRAHTPRAPRLTYRAERTAFTYPYEGRAHYQALIAALAVDTQRNEQIAADVAREASAGHPCLVLSERRDHLEALAALLPGELAIDQVTSSVRPAQRKQVMARFERGELQVLLATSQIALELIRTPRVSRAFVAFPFSYARRLERLVEQLLQPAAGKTSATLYDYDDAEVTPLQRAFDKRARLVERLRKDAEREYLRWAQLSLLDPG